MEKYYIIHNGDGDTTVEELTKEEVLKRINENGDGSYYGEQFLTDLPKNDDTNTWGGYPLIIKGQVVSPKPIEVVKSFDIQ